MAEGSLRRRRLGAVLALLLGLLLATGWSLARRLPPGFLNPERLDRVEPDAGGRTAPAHPVVLVSIDGLAPWLMTDTPTPTLDRLCREGACTLEATNVSPSITLVNHTSMLSGLPSRVHGVDWNDYTPWRSIEVPTVFTHCKSAGLRCGLMAGKTKLLHLADRETGVERWQRGRHAAEVFALAWAYWTERRPDFLMVHVADVDRLGHREGWGSRTQRRALMQIDARLGRFLFRIRRDAPALRILVTADHGGFDHHHRGGRPEEVTIPWITWGYGVSPETLTGPVSILDTAPTLLAWLGGAGERPRPQE